MQEEEQLHKHNVEKLQMELNSQQKALADVTTLADELKDELITQKRKHATNLKDLTKQLQQG